MKQHLVNNIQVVSPHRSEEKQSSDYIEYLNNKVKNRIKNKGDLFYNEGKTYASLLMATLLSNTHDSLKMYCTGLRPGILCGKHEGDGLGYEGAYWEAFKEFFTEYNINNFKGKIQILIQTKKWLHNLPFKKVFECKRKCPGKIEIGWIRKKGIGNLFAPLNYCRGLGKNNFAIFDERAYRIEYDPDRFLANGSFYDPKMCSFLAGIFDEEFKNSQQICSEND